MLTERIDRALDALVECRTRLPAFRDIYSEGTPERAALDGVLAAIERADATLTAPQAPNPYATKGGSQCR